jgi:hypothetical protein
LNGYFCLFYIQAVPRFVDTALATAGSNAYMTVVGKLIDSLGSRLDGESVSFHGHDTTGKPQRKSLKAMGIYGNMRDNIVIVDNDIDAWVLEDQGNVIVFILFLMFSWWQTLWRKETRE